MFKLIKRKGFLLINRDLAGKHTWVIDGTAVSEIADGRSLEAQIRDSAQCYSTERNIDWITQIPQEEVKCWKDVCLPVALAAIVVALAISLFTLVEDNAFEPVPLTADLVGTACTIALGFAGIWIARALPSGRRLHPRPKNVLKKQGISVIGLLLVILLGLLLIKNVPVQTFFSWLENIREFLIPKPIWIAIAFMSLLAAFFSRLIGQVLADRSATFQDQRLSPAPCLRLLKSYWQWRIYLADMPCPQQHPTHSVQAQSSLRPNQLP